LVKTILKKYVLDRIWLGFSDVVIATIYQSPSGSTAPSFARLKIIKYQAFLFRNFYHTNCMKTLLNFA